MIRLAKVFGKHFANTSPLCKIPLKVAFSVKPFFFCVLRHYFSFGVFSIGLNTKTPCKGLLWCCTAFVVLWLVSPLLWKFVFALYGLASCRVLSVAPASAIFVKARKWFVLAISPFAPSLSRVRACAFQRQQQYNRYRYRYKVVLACFKLF